MDETSRAGADQSKVGQEAWTMLFLPAYPGLGFQKVIVMKQTSNASRFVGACLRELPQRETA